MDVGPSMDIAPPSGGETSLEMAIRVANQIVQQKVGLRGVYSSDSVRYKHKGGRSGVAGVAFAMPLFCSYAMPYHFPGMHSSHTQLRSPLGTMCVFFCV